jgi:hypothetical protein
MQRLQPFQPGWGPPMLGSPPAPRRNRRSAAIVGAFLLIVCWLAGLTSSPVGLLTIGLVFAVIYLLASHRRDGTLGRALVEYALVALAAALFMAHAGVTPKVSVPAPPTSQSLEQSRQSILDGWEGIATGFTNWREGAGR